MDGVDGVESWTAGGRWRGRRVNGAGWESVTFVAVRHSTRERVRGIALFFFPFRVSTSSPTRSLRSLRSLRSPAGHPTARQHQYNSGPDRQWPRAFQASKHASMSLSVERLSSCVLCGQYSCSARGPIDERCSSISRPRRWLCHISPTPVCRRPTTPAGNITTTTAPHRTALSGTLHAYLTVNHMMSFTLVAPGSLMHDLLLSRSAGPLSTTFGVRPGLICDGNCYAALKFSG